MMTALLASAMTLSVSACPQARQLAEMAPKAISMVPLFSQADWEAAAMADWSEAGRGEKDLEIARAKVKAALASVTVLMTHAFPTDVHLRLAEAKTTLRNREFRIARRELTEFVASARSRETAVSAVLAEKAATVRRAFMADRNPVLMPLLNRHLAFLSRLELEARV